MIHRRYVKQDRRPMQAKTAGRVTWMPKALANVAQL